LLAGCEGGPEVRHLPRIVCEGDCTNEHALYSTYTL
jgi:hypothetical protein